RLTVSFCLYPGTGSCARRADPRRAHVGSLKRDRGVRARRSELGAALKHAMVEVEPGVRLHLVTAGEGARTIVLLHGFPQTWWEWRHVIPVLADRGFRVIAPDYRGAGHSQRPATGYDKLTMAGDIRRLLRQHLRVNSSVILVCHDIV